MTRFERATGEAMALGMRRSEAEHDASLTICPKCDEDAHPVNPECDRCRGTGHHIGGDDLRPCPSCSLWGRRPVRSPFVARAMAGTLVPKVVA